MLLGSILASSSVVPYFYIPVIIIVLAIVLALVFSAINTCIVASVKLGPGSTAGEEPLKSDDGLAPQQVTNTVSEITLTIQEGANAFLFAEYKILAIFIVGFSIFLFALLCCAGAMNDDKEMKDKFGKAFMYVDAVFSTIAFVMGATTSVVSGFVGMRIAVFANGRTALQAEKSVGAAFVTAFTAGTVMGFSLVGLGLLNLYLLISVFMSYYNDFNDAAMMQRLYEAVASYGLGGSSIALFGRVGGGIYTKAADVGADLVGKVEAGIPEDDPRNPATIADNVGDNVGDIAGMGADLFGSFAEATCAALVISGSEESHIGTNYNAMMFPLLIHASGIFTCFFTSFLATHIMPVKTIKDIEPRLKQQLAVSTILETPVIFLFAWMFFPAGNFVLPGVAKVTFWKVGLCIASGLWAGLAIGYITEFYTSHSYGPVKEVANSCETGAATNIIYGLALGYLSVIIPSIALAIAIFVGHKCAGMYGIAMCALGMLSTMTIGLTIDAYGPISDNAGGIAEMAGLGDEVREKTDALDAAGNTTAAIGKGFAIGSAALVSLALFGAFVTRAMPNNSNINVLDATVFSGLLIGAMLPYAFSAMTMKSVGKAAMAMVEEVRRQFRTIPGIMEGTGRPDYKRCVAISTTASLREMILPGVLVMGSPFVVGFLFGIKCLSGLLAGGLVSGVQMAISSSNTGGAWDNAKKYIEQGNHGGKGSEPHKAAVVGDTVGDPLKDTSGPALNILMKLMAILSLVLAPFFKEFEGGVIQEIYNKIKN